MERKCPLLSIWTPDLPVHFGQSFNTEAIRSIHRNPQGMYAKQPKWTESWEKAALRTEGVRMRRHYQTSIILSCNHKQSSHKIMKKCAVFQRLTATAFNENWQICTSRVKALWWQVCEIPSWYIMTHDRNMEHGRSQRHSTWHMRCVLMSAKFMPYATKHSVVSAFPGAQTTHWH